MASLLACVVVGMFSSRFKLGIFHNRDPGKWARRVRNAVKVELQLLVLVLGFLAGVDEAGLGLLGHKPDQINAMARQRPKNHFKRAVRNRK